MSKGNRNRGERQKVSTPEAREWSKKVAEERGAFVDPQTPGYDETDLARLLSGQDTADLREQARAQGCTCAELDVQIAPIAGPNGERAVELLALHDDHCPLLRVLSEGSR